MTRHSGYTWPVLEGIFVSGAVVFAQRLAAGCAEAVFAAVDGAALGAGAANPRLTQFPQRKVFAQHSFERPQLGIGAGGVIDLRLHEVRALAPEAIQFEHKASDIA